MTRIENTIATLLILYFLIQGSVSLSQEKYWGPDTLLPAPRHIQTYGEALNYSFGALDPYLTTNILINRNPHISPKHEFDGQNLEDTLTLDKFYRIYTEMTDAQVPYQDEQISLYDLNRKAKAHYEEKNEVLIGAFLFEYEELLPTAKISRAVYWDAYQVKVAPNVNTEDILAKRETFGIIPLLDDISTNGEVTFKFDFETSFTNQDNQIEHIAVDFGDGGGFVNLTLGESYTAFYPEAGNHDLTFLVQYTDGTYTQSRGKVKTSYETIIVDPVCGGGYEIVDNVITIEFPKTQFDINVPEVISNPANPGGLVKTKVGVWYGCGETCDLDKPFIIVSGYGPDINKKTLWSTESEMNLYNHYNGVYGEQASGWQESGFSNGTNLLYKLRNEGYDIVIIEFENGVDYPQNHAEAVIGVIEEVNSIKASNGSKHENVVMGQSMGGISSRIALARWEHERMSSESPIYQHHQVRTWISWEGEMQGATIPMGLQLYVKYILHDIPTVFTYAYLTEIALNSSTPGQIGAIVTDMLFDLEFFYQSIDNPGAKSMLTYHFENNSTPFDIGMNKHPLNLALFQTLDFLGYPNQVRRVAISEGSSTAEKPLGLIYDQMGLALNQCLANFRFWILSTPHYLQAKIQTGRVLSAEEVFKGRLLINGVPILTCTKTIEKMYPRAEYQAPGSFERFYKNYAYRFAQYWPLSCHADDYRAPFVPITSAFDIQDDNSLGYDYNVVANDLFWSSPSRLESSFGYPHIMGMENKTPFHSLYANSKNEFHNQNPELGIASFLISEISNDELKIQNRAFQGTLNDIYYANFHARTFIEVGKNVSSSSHSGAVTLESHSELELSAPKTTIKSGFHCKVNSSLWIHCQSTKPNRCFQVGENSIVSYKHKPSSNPNNSLSNLVTDYPLTFPNPCQGTIYATIPDDWINSSYELIDLTGGIVSSGFIKTHKQKFSVPTGTYLLRLIKDQEMSTFKIISL